MEKSYTFKTILIKAQTWVFAPLPDHIKIEAVHAFGRTPIIATFNNKTWSTSIWTEKSARSMISIPKKIRGLYMEGDEIELTFIFDYDRF